MTSKTQIKAIATVLIGLAMLIGCAGGPKPIAPEAKDVVKPPRPRAAPKATVMALDPALRERATNLIEADLRSDDLEMRANAIEAAQDTLGAAAEDAYVRGMSDPEWVVRFASVMAVGKLRLTDLHDRVYAMATSDPDDNVKVATRYALHRMGDTSLSHDLEKWSRSPRKSVRANVALVLGLLGEKSAIKILVLMQVDREPAVRLETAEALWRLGDQRGLEELVGGTVSTAPDDQIVSLLALAAPKDQRVIEHIRGELVSDYPEVSLAAARAMGQLGSDEGYAIAQHGAASTDPRQRALAAFAFGDINRSDSQPILDKLLSDTDPKVRLAAATAVLKLKA